MRIGIDIRNIGKKRTGDEQVFFNLVKNLAKIDSENEYWLFTDVTDATLLDSNVVKPLGIESKPNFKIISLKSSNKFIWNAWTLPNYLRKNPVDIYHTQYITPFFVPKSIKIITTIHDISFNFFSQFIKWRDLFFLKTLISLSLKRADKVIAVSQFTKSEIIKFYQIDPQKVEVALNAVADNFADREYNSQELERVRKKYDLPEKFILYLGTMQPRKNLPFLIKAYDGAKEKLGNFKLVIAGKKAHNYDKEIDEIVAKYNLKKDVIFPGYIEEKDKPAIFKLALVFVFPSLYEGFGIPVLEAMSQGVPVLASDIPSLRETAGDAALYFDPSGLASLEKKLYNICINHDSRNNLIAKGLRRSRVFSWSQTAKKILGVYRQIGATKH